MAIVLKDPSRPAPPSNPAATQSTADTARAAVLKMLETSKIDDSTAPVEAGDLKQKTPQNDEEADVVEESPVQEKVEDAPEEKEGEPAEEEKPVEKVEKKEEKKLSDPLKNSFERLAVEKSELRKRETELKERESRVAKYETLDRMAANGDALGALSVLGIKQSTLIKQSINKNEAVEEDDAPEPALSSAAEQRIAKLEQTIAQERNQRSHAEMKGRVVEFVKGSVEKFPNLDSDPSLAGEVVKYMLDFTMQAGRPPGETIEESIQMAAEAVEEREEKTLQKLLKRRGLTIPVKSVDTGNAGSKSAVAPAASELAKKSRTLTNSHASSARAVGSTTAETVEELRAKALAQLNGQA